MFGPSHIKKLLIRHAKTVAILFYPFERAIIVDFWPSCNSF